MSAPTYEIDDVVYLRESAMAGFIESYRVTAIEFEPKTNQWLYKMAIRHSGPETSTVVDSYALHRFETLRFRESELVTLCEALDMAIIKTEERLAYLQGIKSSRCGGTEGSIE